MFASSVDFAAASVVAGMAVGLLLLLYKFPLAEIMRSKRMDMHKTTDAKVEKTDELHNDDATMEDTKTTNDAKEPAATTKIESNEKSDTEKNLSSEVADKPTPNSDSQLPRSTLLIAKAIQTATGRVRPYVGDNAKLVDVVLNFDAPIGTTEVRLLFGEEESEVVMRDAHNPQEGCEPKEDEPGLSFTAAALMLDQDVNASGENPIVLVARSDIVDELMRSDENEGEIVDTKEENGTGEMDGMHVKAEDARVGEDKEALETKKLEANVEGVKEQEPRIDQEDSTPNQAERIPLSPERCFRAMADKASTLPGSLVPSDTALVDRSDGRVQAFKMSALDAEGEKGEEDFPPKSENTGDVDREEPAEETGGSSIVTSHHARVEDALDDAA